MRDERHYTRLLDQNPSASVGFTLAASAVFAARYGFCEPMQHSTGEWREIARRLKSEYGEILSTDEVRAEMKLAERSAAAAVLGSIGGSVQSDAKTKAARENARKPPRPGSAPRGRPRKGDDK